MTLTRFITINNGGVSERFLFFSCDNCGKEIPESSPRYTDIGSGCIPCKHYCGECAFKLELITEKQYIKTFCYWNAFVKRAAVNPQTGEVEITDRKFSWEKTDKDYRHSTQYTTWRVAVFERDHYTCLDCGRVGGKLEAHHIKTFRKYPRLRFAVENGITLCTKCHKQKHKKVANG